MGSLFDPPASTRPTLYLSNWSSSRTPGMHGPGRALTIMANPRTWERGVGVVRELQPDLTSLLAVKAGDLPMEDYRVAFGAHLERLLADDALRLGLLTCRVANAISHVADGDTLCCACSRVDAAAGRCHRTWATPTFTAPDGASSSTELSTPHDQDLRHPLPRRGRAPARRPL